jgi:alanine dehydrogenase
VCARITANFAQNTKQNGRNTLQRAATSRCPTEYPTSHEKPTYQEHGVIHYAVPNMPALVGRTSTMGLTQATEPFVTLLVQKGIERALADHKGLARGVNTRDGKITYDAVAKALGYA